LQKKRVLKGIELYNMHTTKSVFLAIILFVISGTAFAQNNTNSPYTLYGYGKLTDKASTFQRGMGGIGYGLRNPQLINPLNPASFSAVDSMTFMFDIGITGQMFFFKDGSNSERDYNSSLDYITFQFPLTKKIGFGAGFEPVSSVGYNFMDTTVLPVDNNLIRYTANAGRGGLSRVYGVLSYEFLNQFSAGIKLSYLFGEISRTLYETYDVQSIYNFSRTDTLHANGLLYDLGMQYSFSTGKFKTVTIGAVYTPKTRLNSQIMRRVIRMDPSSGTANTLEHWASKDSVFELAQSFGLGFTYNQLGKFTVGADVLYQNWANVKFYDKANVLNNRLKLNAGGEFIPNRTSNNMLNKIHYRAGLYYSNSYVKVKNSKYNEYGANIGFGVPLQNRRSTNRNSFINLSFEYSRVQPELNTLINEQYFKVSLGFTFNELWFFKQRVQ